MIVSFACKETEKLFQRKPSRKLPGDIQRRARNKLLMIHAAMDINDLVVPPGNRLEALSGDRDGQYSVRVNQQWRVCFGWDGRNAHDVEIVDYH